MECISERIFKISQYLVKIWTTVSWHLYGSWCTKLV